MKRVSSRWKWTALKIVGVVLATEALLRIAFLGLVVGGTESVFAMGDLKRIYVSHHLLIFPNQLPEMTGPLYAPDPRRGYKLGPDRFDAGAYGAPVHTNGLGARGRRTYQRKKPDGVVRYVAVGDSLTFGEGVADHQTWPARLGASLRGTEVINFGVAAYGLDQVELALTDAGLPLEPDRVLVGFYAPDIERTLYSFYVWEKPRWVRDDEGWRLTNVPVPGLADVRRMAWHPLLWTLPRALYQHLSVERGTSIEDQYELARHILTRMRRACAEAGTDLTFVYLPGANQLAQSGTTERGSRQFFRDFCHARGADCVDTTDALIARCGAAGKPPCYQEDREHPTSFGHQLIAETVRTHLARDNAGAGREGD